jgi:hypothetical protein
LGICVLALFAPLQGSIVNQAQGHKERWRTRPLEAIAVALQKKGLFVIRYVYPQQPKALGLHLGHLLRIEGFSTPTNNLVN